MSRRFVALIASLLILCAAAPAAGAAMVNSPQLGPDGNLWAAWKALDADREGPAVDGIVRVDRSGRRSYLHSGPYGSGFQISPRALASRDASSMWMVGEQHGWDPADGLYNRYALWILDTHAAAAKPDGSQLDASVVTLVLRSPPEDPELLYVNPIAQSSGTLWGVGSQWQWCEEPWRGRLIRIDPTARTAGEASWPGGDDGRRFAFDRGSLAVDGRQRLWASLFWPEPVRCPTSFIETSRWDRSHGVLTGDGSAASLHHGPASNEIGRCNPLSRVTTANDGSAWCIAQVGLLRFGEDLAAPDGFRLADLGYPLTLTPGPAGSIWTVLEHESAYRLVRITPEGQTYLAPAELGGYLRGLSTTMSPSLTGDQAIVGTTDGGLFLTAGLDGRWEGRYDRTFRFVPPGEIAAVETPGPQLPRVSAQDLATTPQTPLPSGNGSAAPNDARDGTRATPGVGGSSPTEAEPRLRASVRITQRVTRRQVLRQRGLRLRVRTNLAAAATATIALSPRLQRRLGFKPPRWSATITQRKPVRAGETTVAITFPRPLLSQVRRNRRRISLPVRTRLLASGRIAQYRTVVTITPR